MAEGKKASARCDVEAGTPSPWSIAQGEGSAQESDALPSRLLRLILIQATTIVVVLALTSDAPPMLAVAALVAVLAVGIGRTTGLVVALAGTAVRTKPPGAGGDGV